MKPEFLGDSYDIVKQSFLRWLVSMGSWATHPMFSESVSAEQAEAFARFLGTQLLSRELFSHEVDRNAYLAPARYCDDHVFLDPDTGIRLKPIRGKKAPRYLFGAELVTIASARPEKLTLVFEQSLQRGAERQQLECKLSMLADAGLHAVAYFSQACFVLVGKDSSLVEKAIETVKRESHLPDSRFVPPQNKAMQGKSSQRTG